MEEKKEAENRQESECAQEEKIFTDVKPENKKADGVVPSGEFYSPEPVISREDTLARINAAREKFLTYANQQDKIKKIILLSFLGIFFLLAIVLLINPKLTGTLFTPLIVVFVVFLLVTYFLVQSAKKKKSIQFDEYRYRYFLAVESYCYFQLGISDLSMSYNSRIDPEEVKAMGCYENIVDAPSRDIVKGAMFGIGFTCAEVKIVTGDSGNKKNQSALFAGKLFHFDLECKKSGKMYLYLKGCGDGFPTELQGMEEVELKDLKKEFKVFSSFERPEGMIGKKTAELLNRFVIDDVVEDIIVSISGKGVYIGLSLTRDYMTIPYENEVDGRGIDHLKNDLDLIKNLIVSLLSNKNYRKPEENVG